tara:strand:+ start:285 stop:869 length:585 start_codon:yes stop_codon:yes gene_type:complete
MKQKKMKKKGHVKPIKIKGSRKLRTRLLVKINIDPLYQSRLITLLIRRVMKQGKKNLAVRLVYNTLYKLQSIYKRSFSTQIIGNKNEGKLPFNKFPAKILECALRKVAPRFRIIPKRRGRRWYYIPIGIRFDRAINYVVRWLVNIAYYCYLRHKTPSPTRAIFRRRLARAIWRTARSRGGALKQKFYIQQFTYR